MKTRYLILIAGCALYGTNAYAACANNQTCGTNCCWDLTGGTLTISTDNKARAGAMENYGLSETPWYSQRKTIKSVVVEGANETTGTKGITSIGNYAFYGAEKMTSVVIPESVTSIGDSAFFKASSLTSVTIPNSITAIADRAFYGAISLTSVTSPDSVTSIGAAAFSSGTNYGRLETLVIPDSVTSIGDVTFGMQPNLTSLILSDSVESIGYRIFNQAPKLNSLVIPDSVSLIADNAFLGTGSNGTLYCPSTLDCTGKGYNGTIVSYTKGDDGVYTTSDGTTYASPEDMQNNLACTTDCAEKVAAYKDAKAQSMAGGSLCATKDACLNLLDMVSDSNYTCGTGGAKNTIANCSAYVKANNIELASLYDRTPPVKEEEIVTSNGGEDTGGLDDVEKTPSAPARADIRIYTIDEANQVAGKTNSFKIRYR